MDQTPQGSKGGVKMNTNLREYYTTTFKEDLEGLKIDSQYTFKDLHDMMYYHDDIYRYLDIDSVIRERLFKKLSQLMNVDYDYVYNLWLGNIKNEDIIKVKEGTIC